MIAQLLECLEKKEAWMEDILPLHGILRLLTEAQLPKNQLEIVEREKTLMFTHSTVTLLGAVQDVQ